MESDKGQRNHPTPGRVLQRGPTGTGPAVHGVVGAPVRMKGSILLILGDSFENIFARWPLVVTAAVGRFGWLPLVVGAGGHLGARLDGRSAVRGHGVCSSIQGNSVELTTQKAKELAAVAPNIRPECLTTHTKKS